MAPIKKSVLITGCSEGGIGDYLAREFHSRGLRVFATARNLTKIQHLKELNLETFQLDVTDEVSVREAVEKVTSLTGGKLDILVNNSGGGITAPFLDQKMSEIRAMFEVNFFAVIACTQAFAPLLVASKGTVINIGSVAGKVPLPFGSTYNASKAAVNHITESMGLELAPLGVKAICVITGAVKTNFFVNKPSQPTLPADSRYNGAKKEIENAMNGDLIMKDGISAESYAKIVVNNALKTTPKGNQWVNDGGIWLGSVLSLFFPSFWSFALGQKFGLTAITKKVAASVKSTA